jgi:predicted DNA-binding transcriptional regulator AlpA
MSEQEFIDERELARRFGLRHTTLQSWRRRLDGPPFYKIGRTVRYDPAEVATWLKTCRVGGE